MQKNPIFPSKLTILLLFRRCLPTQPSVRRQSLFGVPHFIPFADLPPHGGLSFAIFMEF
jgi:hypothetical protein